MSDPATDAARKVARAGDPDFPYMLADTPEEFERVRRIGTPAIPATDAAIVEERVEHNHVTRDIKPVGKCPACDKYWRITYRPGSTRADAIEAGRGER